MKNNSIRIIFIFATLAITGLAYQNCGSGSQGGGLNFGSPGPTPGGASVSCTAPFYLIAATNSCGTCTYGYNSSTLSCYPAPAPGQVPRFSCKVAAAGSTCANVDANRCTTPANCAASCGETVCCTANSFIGAPNDGLQGCLIAAQGGNCNANILSDASWTKSPSASGTFTYSWINNASNNGNASDIIQSARVKDSTGQFSTDFTYTIKSCSAVGATSCPATTITLTGSYGQCSLPIGASTATTTVINAFCRLHSWDNKDQGAIVTCSNGAWTTGIAKSYGKFGDPTAPSGNPIASCTTAINDATQVGWTCPSPVPPALP